MPLCRFLSLLALRWRFIVARRFRSLGPFYRALSLDVFPGSLPLLVGLATKLSIGLGSIVLAIRLAFNLPLELTSNLRLD